MDNCMQLLPVCFSEDEGFYRDNISFTVAPGVLPAFHWKDYLYRSGRLSNVINNNGIMKIVHASPNIINP